MKNFKNYRSLIIRSMSAAFLVLAANPASAVILSTGNFEPAAESGNIISRNSLEAGQTPLDTSINLSLLANPVYEDVSFVDGVQTSVDAFSGLDKGTYSLTLTDFEFPEALSSLGASITSATDMVGSLLLGEQSSRETLIFEIEQPDTYYLSVFGIAGSTYNLGMYGVELSQLGVSAVPLPAAAYLFFSGLMGLVFAGRGKGLRLPHTRTLGLR